jgi:hypothetical protein
MSVMSSPPQKAGLPCWRRADVPEAIASVAQLDTGRAHYFLASHTPIRNIRDDRARASLDEEELYSALLTQAHDEVLAVVHGEPGTGKSHLIHWLKLRLDHARQRGEHDEVVHVLIRRRTGSLKDALEQLVHQLPESFARYLDPVKQALGRISEETARQELANELRLELSVRRPDRGRSPMPHHLKDLSETVSSQGFRDWLCREGGPIDQIVQRLSKSSEVEEREALPTFTPQDFEIRDARCLQNNTPRTQELIDDLSDEREYREEAAKLFNEVLADALKEMTGLSGNTLRDIFDQIRMDLAKDGKTLAVFVEDVSVMPAGLDADIVNAFEPQSRSDLCRTIAVLGMTETGVNQLHDNQLQRITHMVSVGEGVMERWERDPTEVARFSARYLNALRLSEEQVRQVAQQRRGGGDVSQSACDACPVREKCHATFGKVDLDGTVIGLFPFSPRAPQVLLKHLDERAQGVRRNPRGLLMHVLHPVLDKQEALETRDFPNVRLPVRLQEIPFWRGFEDSYCGGWQRRDRERLKVLAQAWIHATSADQAAALLEPFLEPLGFPEFSRETEEVSPLVHPADSPTHAPAEPEENEKLNELLQELAVWMETGHFKRDAEPRDLLAGLLDKSIRWEDQREIPKATWSDHVRRRSFISIEGMRSKTRSGDALFFFDRSQKTRDLIEALAQYEYVGKGSWNFEYGERHKRRISRWLRNHREEVIQSLQPRDGLDPHRPVQTAVQFLAASSLITRRANLPREPDRLVSAVLDPLSEESPVALSDHWRRWIEKIRGQHERVRGFLIKELAVLQGRGGGDNFIDPLPVLEGAKTFSDDPTVEALPEGYFSQFWQSRYAPLEKLDGLAPLEHVANVERAAIEDRLRTLTTALNEDGYESADGEAIQAYCTDLLGMLGAQKQAEIVIPDEDFDALRNRKVFHERSTVWARAVDQGHKSVKEEQPIDVLLFDPAPLQEVVSALDVARRFIDKLEKHVEDQLDHIEKEGDPDQITEILLADLARLASNDGQEMEKAS